MNVRSLVTVGGNGTLAGARQFAAENDIQVVGVPATIDNDFADPETALGFDTTENNAMHGIEQLNDTAASHHRIIVVETMGRDCGNLARMAALAGGAEIVIAPERGLHSMDKMRRIAQRLEESFLCGQTHAIVVVAEGVRADGSGDDGPAAKLRVFLEHHFEGSEGPNRAVVVRDTVLGHHQRGGSPSAADRLLAGQLANAVWCAIIHKPPQSGVAVVRRGRIEIRSFDDHRPVDVTDGHDVSCRVQKAVTIWTMASLHFNTRKAHYEHPAP